MRIIIDTGLEKCPSEYGNVGDVSMLQVSVSRLQKLFPGASIEVLTDSAERLARFCPGAKPLDDLGRRLWFANGVLLGKYLKIVPAWFLSLLVWSKKTFRSRCPGLFGVMLIWRLRIRNRPKDADAVAAFTRAFQNADLLLISGAGGFYDGCQHWNIGVLDLVEAVVQKGIPVAMLGQGFGPVSDPLVLAQARRVLPAVDFITLRGNRGAFDALRSLGVPQSKIQITGDEALELAYESKTDEPGRSLGVNLRFAGSASTGDDDVQQIRRVLQDFARNRLVSLVPLPIAIHANSRDDVTIKQLLEGFDEKSDGGKNLDSPIKVIKQAALCRVVVTGAYHAAVFALAQGIPVVGLAKSAYFSSKFFGLQDLFGEGCQTIILNEPALPQRLQDAIEKAWENANEFRQPLQAAALRQIELSRKSYEKVYDLVAAENVNRCPKNAQTSKPMSSRPTPISCGKGDS